MTGVETLLLGAAASAGTAGAAGAAAAATSGLIGTAGAFSWGTALGTLSTGLSLASGASALFGAGQQADAMEAQSEQEARALALSAREDDIAAQQEETRGKQESNDMLDGLIQTIASQKLAFAANGVDVGFGTPENVAVSTRKLANLQMGVTREDAQVRALARRRQSYARQEESLNVLSAGKQKASATRMTGLASGATSIGNLVERRVTRG